MNQLLTVADVAAILQQSVSTVYKLVEYSDLGDYCTRLGLSGRGKILFREGDLDAWLDSRKGRPLTTDVNRLAAKSRKTAATRYGGAAEDTPQSVCGADVEVDSSCCDLPACKREEPQIGDAIYKQGRISNIKSRYFNNLSPRLTKSYQKQLKSYTIFSLELFCAESGGEVWLREAA